MYRGTPRERVTAWLAAHVPEDAVRLREPVDSPDAVPEPVRPLYRFADGQVGGRGLFDRFRFLPATEAGDEKAMMDQLARDEAWDEEWWSERWHPFASDFAGQLLVVDDVSGEVIEFIHDDEGRPVLAPSVDAFLDGFVESIVSGQRVWDERLGIIEVTELERAREARARVEQRQAEAVKLTRRGVVVAVLVSLALFALLVLLDRWLRGS